MFGVKLPFMWVVLIGFVYVAMVLWKPGRDCCPAHSIFPSVPQNWKSVSSMIVDSFMVCHWIFLSAYLFCLTVAVLGGLSDWRPLNLPASSPARHWTWRKSNGSYRERESVGSPPTHGVFFFFLSFRFGKYELHCLSLAPGWYQLDSSSSTTCNPECTNCNWWKVQKCTSSDSIHTGIVILFFFFFMNVLCLLLAYLFCTPHDHRYRCLSSFCQFKIQNHVYFAGEDLWYCFIDLFLFIAHFGLLIWNIPGRAWQIRSIPRLTKECILSIVVCWESVCVCVLL